MTSNEHVDDDIRGNLRDYVSATAPLETVGSWEKTTTYPSDFFDGLARMGYLGLHIPAEHGGEGLGANAMAIVGEELGRGGLELAVSYGLTAFPTLTLCKYGTAGQIEQYVPDMMSHRQRFAVGISEPEAGSDAAATRTRARAVDGGYIVNGQKLWTSGAEVPGTTMQALVRTSDAAKKQQGLSALLIPMNADGVELRRIPTVGRHILGTYEVFFRDVFVPSSALLGEEGDGWSVIGASLEIERIFAAAELAGCARTALDFVVSYVSSRQQFGRSIGSFQTIAHQLARVEAELQAARLLAYQAASSYDAESPSGPIGSAAKLLTSECFQKVTELGMQFMGGYGYSQEYPLERMWREARSTTVSAGASEIQLTIIARSIGLNPR